MSIGKRQNHARCGLRAPLLALALLLAVPSAALAQLRVEIELPRRLYMIYEPVIASVKIRNLAGRDITLRDADGVNWFGFEIQRRDGSLVAPRARGYELDPLELRAGTTLRRNINLTPLFSLQEFGSYRIRALIHYADQARYYASGFVNLEITEGNTIWQQEVGVPESGGTRRVKLLSFRMPEGNRLYVRVVDPASGIVYCNMKLGRLLSQHAPQVAFGRENIIHILHPAAPRMYLFTRMDLDGKVLERETYLAPKVNPVLRANEDGIVLVEGGVVERPPESGAADAQPAPALSERPPGLPEPAAP